MLYHSRSLYHKLITRGGMRLEGGSSATISANSILLRTMFIKDKKFLQAPSEKPESIRY